MPQDAGARPAEEPSSPARERALRAAGALSLLAAPLLLALGEVALLGVGGAGGTLAVIGAAVPAWQAGQLGLLAWSVALLPAGLTLAALARPRAPLWADAGAVLTAAGALAGVALASVNLVVGEMARVGPEPGVARLVERTVALAAPLEQLGQLRMLGLLVLGLGLYRAAAVPRQVVALLLVGVAVPGVGAAARFVSGAAWLPGAGWLLAAGLQLAALAWVAREVRRGAPSERGPAGWEGPVHPPWPNPGRFTAAMIALFLPGAMVSALGFVTWLTVALALGMYRLAPVGQADGAPPARP